MKIIKSAIGNSEEAFIESSFSDGFNIISSDDNNKGKTIVIQSILYTLGNEPTFPTSFEYKNYYHYVEFEVENKQHQLCRYNDSYVLKHKDSIMMFETVSELKRYWTKHISHLPVISKNEIQRIVDPVLLIQLFFVGQDKKDTSNIANAGLYNKADFYQMIYDLCGVGSEGIDEKEILKLREQIKKLKDERALLLNQAKILKGAKTPISYLSSENDRICFEKKLAELEALRLVIEELRKKRNKIATLKSKWETTLKELNSLNRTLSSGELRCMDCHSTNICFNSSSKGAYSFDISTVDMRKRIVTSITEKISDYNEEIERLSSAITIEQEKLKAIMSDEQITLEAIVAFKSDVFSVADVEEKLNSINENLSSVQSQINAKNGNVSSNKAQRESILKSIVDIMQDAYLQIDSSSNQTVTDIFTKKHEVYSGSEATIFHLVKLYALKIVTKHKFPIIIDSFRAEDLSTAKEKIVLDLFKKFNDQIILTTTLKAQEMGKYDEVQEINHIDYKGHTPNKLLSADYVGDFKQLISCFSFSML